jgi:hypothetical protein
MLFAIAVIYINNGVFYWQAATQLQTTLTVNPGEEGKPVCNSYITTFKN